VRGNRHEETGKGEERQRARKKRGREERKRSEEEEIERRRERGRGRRRRRRGEGDRGTAERLELVRELLVVVNQVLIPPRQNHKPIRNSCQTKMIFIFIYINIDFNKQR